jgi:hypothetical protein
MIAVALIVIDVDTVERDAVEERRHVLDRVDRDADASDLRRPPADGPSRSPFACGKSKATLSPLTPCQEIAVPAVGLRSPDPNPAVLPHRPQPALGTWSAECRG